ncbi:4-hydroxyacetophenone monooxygenase [compost metagenome]
MSPAPTPHVSTLIVGSGFSGLGMAIRLKQDGQDDFLVLERAEGLGGTWRDNTYPGCACDVESHLYSFSFAPNPHWTRMYSHQPEILAYLEAVAERYGLGPHLRFGHAVREAAWDDGAGVWRVETSQGPFTADTLVAGFGALSEPAEPNVPGLGAFEGPVFHSARWNHGVDLTGKRVAVIGTGASAIQFVPAIQPKAGRLTLFQRTPPWIMPRHDRPISPLERLAFQAFPPAQAVARGLIYAYRELYVFGFRDPKVMAVAQTIARAHLAAQVRDPALRAKLTPDYAMGCKRILLSNDYYPALTRPNVEVVTDRIDAVTPTGVVTADGTDHPAEVIILGTGFKATDPPFARHVRGRDGRTLAETWAGSPKAHAGTTVAGFPNLFLLFGPNTGLGHTSVVLMLESQLEHVMAALRHLRRRGAQTIEPRAEAQAAYVAGVDRMMDGTVWTAGGCRSWYLDESGRNSTLWPGFTAAFGRQVGHFDPADYALGDRARGPVAGSAR